jgi:hypothetical protein
MIEHFRGNNVINVNLESQMCELLWTFHFPSNRAALEITINSHFLSNYWTILFILHMNEWTKFVLSLSLSHTLTLTLTLTLSPISHLNHTTGNYVSLSNKSLVKEALKKFVDDKRLYSLSAKVIPNPKA